ncbi:MAG: hypothetical protein M3081_07340 [Gemmatimonadota bacterium]|nr:hypothetical protein [Gemmatimonadota bacterium]
MRHALVRSAVALFTIGTIAGCVHYDPFIGPVPAKENLRFVFVPPRNLTVKMGGSDTVSFKAVTELLGEAAAVRGDSVTVEIETIRDAQGYFPVTPHSMVTVLRDSSTMVELRKGASPNFIALAILVGAGVILLLLTLHTTGDPKVQ